MKKLFTIAVSTLILLTGCQQIEKPVITTENGNNESKLFTISAGKSDLGGNTKSGYNATGKYMYWTSDDAIGVFVKEDSNNENVEFTQKYGSSNGDTSVDFEGTLTGITNADEETIYAYYPYNENTSISGNTLTIEFPAIQYYNATDNFSNLPAVGKYTGEVGDMDIKFNNLYTIFKLPLTAQSNKETKVMSITFKAQGDQKVAGSMTVDMSGDTFIPDYTSLTQDLITLSCKSPVTLNDQTATDFYIAVPAMNYTDGYVVTIYTDEGRFVKTVNNSGSTHDLSTHMNNILVTPTTVAIPTLWIEDEYFRNYLVAEGLIENVDEPTQSLNLTSYGLNFSSQIYVTDPNITSLQGIEYFQNTTDLRASGTSVNSLDLSNNTKLTYIDIRNCLISSIDFSQNKALKNLYTGGSLISSLDLSNNPNLIMLGCISVSLKSLNLSGCTALTNLQVYVPGINIISDNKIDFVSGQSSGTLEEFIMDDLGDNSNFTEIVCKNIPKIKKLSFKNNTSLTKVETTGSANLTSLDISGCTSLELLACLNTPNLSVLNISGSSAPDQLAIEGLSWSNSSIEIGPVYIISGAMTLTKIIANNMASLSFVQCSGQGSSTITELSFQNCPNIATMNIFNNPDLIKLDVTGSGSNGTISTFNIVNNHPDIEIIGR